MAHLSSANVALTDQVLAGLAEQGGLPISTPALWELLRPPCEGWPHAGCAPHLDYMAVYRILVRLAKRGEIERIKLDDMRPLYWRYWPA